MRSPRVTGMPRHTGRTERVGSVSVALVGPYPPPYGGVSVHIKRVHNRLRQQAIRSRVYSQPLPPQSRPPGVVPTFLRFSWKTWLPTHGWRCGARVVHFHDGWYWAPAVAAMLGRGKQVLWTFHDQETGTVRWRDASWFERQVSLRILRHPALRWVAVSSEVQRQLAEIGVPESRVSVIPAYVPPPPEGPERLPNGVREFLKAHSPVLSTYGWKLVLDAQGIDVYGFDLCVDVVGRLRRDFPRIGLVISLPQIEHVRYFEELKRRAAIGATADRILFLTEPLDEVHSLWGASDVFVRATNTDGDAVSVREALSMHIPVVASDASPRPEGVALFPSRDLAGLEGALRRVLANREAFVESLRSLRVADNFPALLDLYQDATRAGRST